MRGKLLLFVRTGCRLRARRTRRPRALRRDQAGCRQALEQPGVQRQVRNAEDFVKDKAPDVAGFLADGAKKVAAQVSGLVSHRARQEGHGEHRRKSTAPSPRAKRASPPRRARRSRPAPSREPRNERITVEEAIAVHAHRRLPGSSGTWSARDRAAQGRDVGKIKHAGIGIGLFAAAGFFAFFVLAVLLAAAILGSRRCCPAGWPR